MHWRNIMTEELKVEPKDGFNDLVKNTFNKAIINNDERGYQNYILKRQRSIDVDTKIESLETDINNIKGDIKLILSLLQNK